LEKKRFFRKKSLTEIIRTILLGNYQDQEYQYQKKFCPENFKINKYHLNKENKTET